MVIIPSWTKVHIMDVVFACVFLTIIAVAMFFPLDGDAPDTPLSQQANSCILEFTIDNTNPYKNGRRAFFEPGYLSDIQIVNSINSLRGSVKVATITNPENTTYSYRDIAEGLLRLESIKTVIDEDAQICFEKENDKNKTYTLELSVIQKECDGSCSETKEDIEIEINKESGEIVLK